MREIRTILVPVDFAAHSEQALELAIDFAERFAATLHLFHAYSHPTSAAGMFEYSVAFALTTGLRVAAAMRLSEVVAKVQTLGIEASGEVAEGPASRAICEEVERLKPDLLVMGTRGRTGLKHVLLGSVAERTVRSVACPVVTVHDNGN